MAKKKGEKFNSIIDAAIEVIAQYGYYNSKVSEIARRAGLADGTIYLYFENKQDILISLFQEKMGMYMDTLQKRMDAKSNPKDKLFILIVSHFEYLAEDKNLALVSQIELRQANKEIREGIEPEIKRYYRMIQEVIEEGISKKVFRGDINVRAARSMVFGTLDDTVTAWLMTKEKFDLFSMVDPVYKLLVRALNNEY